MRAIIRRWWPVLGFAVLLVGCVAADVASAVSADRRMDQSRRETDQWIAGYNQGRDARRSWWSRVDSLDVLVVLWSVLLFACFALLLAWAAWGIWSAATGEPVTW